MMSKFVEHLPAMAAAGIAWLRAAFDHTATWVTQLSWRKFLLFVVLMLIAGALIQDTLFDNANKPVIAQKNKPGMHAKLFRSAKEHQITTEDGTTIRIDGTGLHITNPTGSKDVPKADQQADVHIDLPPAVGQEVRDALADAVDEAALEEVSVAQKKSSEWFMNFLLLLIVGLFGTKALMGGKKRAEAQARSATAAAERAMLQREITEAKMQVMQAQVEPHFLFNTLASVEYLIETDPPRASAMQRSLIQYLRAVLPQMRDSALATTLGREADMVRSYLDLLKMRMEERLIIDFRIPAGLRSAVFPPMMLQSLVENAVKHGLESKAQGGTLQVLAEIADNRLRVTVADDGRGFGAVPSDGTGMGLQSIRERLKLLYHHDAGLEIVPNRPVGVRATIDVPYHVAGTTSK